MYYMFILNMHYQLIQNHSKNILKDFRDLLKYISLLLVAYLLMYFLQNVCFELLLLCQIILFQIMHFHCCDMFMSLTVNYMNL